MWNVTQTAAVPTFTLAQKHFCWSGFGIRDAASADPSMPAHRHSFFQVFFVASGQAEHQIGERIHTANAGSIFFVSPFVVHRLSFARETECYLLYFDAPFFRHSFGVQEVAAQNEDLYQLPELAPFVYQPQCSYQLDAAETVYVRERCLRIARALSTRSVYDIVEARAELTLIFTCVGRKYESSFRSTDCASLDRRALDHRARKALAYLEGHFKDDLTLADVANKVNLTGNYLTLLLKRETGKSFKQILDELRLENSKQLLAYTDEPIKKIATDSGFLNQAHFSRRFKSFTSLTPGHFRRRHHAQITRR